MVGYAKQGTNLEIQLSNGKTLQVEDFFVIGPDGDFSRLITDSGEAVITGLMGPEPDIQLSPDEGEASVGQQRSAGAMEHLTDGQAGGFGDGGAETGGWSTKALMGAGLSLSSGFGLLLEGQSDAQSAAPEPASSSDGAEASTFSDDVVALTGGKEGVVDADDLLDGQAAENDPNAQDSAAQDPAESDDTGTVTADDAALQASGGLVGAILFDPVELAADYAAQDILAELATESF
ncbi:hypothetical protein N4R57_17360 [Rhodobacteraceae bacterium D3-12]|nr:hypothetical protein N4R57_17360 [Rhodobacteraceae bacterium D3-12]